MSHLLVRTLCKTQAARSLTGRPIFTSSAVYDNSNISREPNDPKVSDLFHAQSIYQAKQSKRFSVKSHKLDNSSTHPLLLTNDIVRPVKFESTETKPLEDGRDKVLSARDVIVDRDNKASSEQLNEIADLLSRHLPSFFSSLHPFWLYSKDVVFIDRTRGIRTQGLRSYTLQIIFVKIYYALNYTSKHLQLLNLVKDPEESSIKIRWRFVCKPGLMRFMLTFYKYHNDEIWRDAISTLYVNKEGKIFCHLCDNIDVEKEGTELKKVVKNPLANRGINL